MKKKARSPKKLEEFVPWWKKPISAYEVHQTLEDLSNELVRRANAIPGRDFRQRNLWLSIAREVKKLEPAKLVDYPLF